MIEYGQVGRRARAEGDHRRRRRCRAPARDARLGDLAAGHRRAGAAAACSTGWTRCCRSCRCRRACPWPRSGSARPATPACWRCGSSGWPSRLWRTWTPSGPGSRRGAGQGRACARSSAPESEGVTISADRGVPIVHADAVRRRPGGPGRGRSSRRRARRPGRGRCGRRGSSAGGASGADVAGSRARNSAHSVSSSTRSAPAQGLADVARTSASGSGAGRCPWPCGSYTDDVGPGRCRSRRRRRGRGSRGCRRCRA